MLVRPQLPLFVRSWLVVYRIYVLPPQIRMSKSLEGGSLAASVAFANWPEAWQRSRPGLHRSAASGNIWGCSSGVSYHFRLLVPNAGHSTTISITAPAGAPGPWNIEGKYDVESGSF